jgi:hypothetical protein
MEPMPVAERGKIPTRVRALLYISRSVVFVMVKMELGVGSVSTAMVRMGAKREGLSVGLKKEASVGSDANGVAGEAVTRSSADSDRVIRICERARGER